MKSSIKIFAGLIIAVCIFAACEKKIDPIDESFTVQVSFKNSGTNFLTADTEVNPKDSIFFDFTLTAEEDMVVVEIQRNNAKIDTFKVPAANARSFSAIKKYAADSIPGDYTYRVLARNNKGVFIGDGKKTIKVTVKSDFNFWSYRFTYVPDSVSKTNKTYFASTTGQTFSYTDGAASSALIDFGYYYDTATANKHTIYALNTAQTQLNFYDITSWTKNATIFKRATTPTFANLTSGGALKTAGLTNLASGTTPKITVLASGNLLFFKTAAGKFGCVQINYIEGASAAQSTYINIDVKVQK